MTLNEVTGHARLIISIILAVAEYHIIHLFFGDPSLSLYLSLCPGSVRFGEAFGEISYLRENCTQGGVQNIFEPISAITSETLVGLLV